MVTLSSSSNAGDAIHGVMRAKDGAIEPRTASLTLPLAVGVLERQSSHLPYCVLIITHGPKMATRPIQSEPPVLLLPALRTLLC